MLRKFLITLFFSLIFVGAYKAQIVENAGQINSGSENFRNVLYYCQSNGLQVYFLQDRISYVMNKLDKEAIHGELNVNKTCVRYRVDMLFNAGIKNGDVIEGESVGQSRYIRKNELTAKMFSSLLYKEVWPGIDLKFVWEKDRLKYDVIVHENGRLSDIRFNWLGATSIITDAAKLMLETPMGTIVEELPGSFDLQGNKVSVEYKVEGNTTSFIALGRQSGLIIDPISSYAGGAGVDEAYGVTTDIYGNAYICGSTTSADFPVSPAAMDTVKSGFTDAFLFKFDKNGQRLWSTFYGGTSDDYAYKVKMTDSHTPVMTGYTLSTDLKVSSSGVYQSVNNGSYDAFITELDSAGSFSWATYFGGVQGELVLAMDRDSHGNLIIGGFTNSTDLPVTNKSAQDTMNGALDGFVAKFTSTGNLDWCTYYGGTNSEDVHSIDCDANDGIIFCGETYSSDWPATPGAYQVNNAGQLDAYLVRLDSAGTLLFATMFGGTADEDFRSVYVNALDEIYVTGYSSGLDFPIIGTNVHQGTLKGNRDGTVVKFDPTGVPLRSTFYGGTDWEEGAAISGCSMNKVQVLGSTRSMDMFTTNNALQDSSGGIQDLYYMELDSALSVSYATYIGGSSGETAYEIARSGTAIWLTGISQSNDFPFVTGGFQTTYNGQEDAFALRLDSSGCDITGIRTLEVLPKKVSIFPNPAGQYFTIKVTDSKPLQDIKVFNALGELIISEYNIQSNRSIIDCSKVASGELLFITVTFSDGTQQVDKVVKF